MPRFFLLVVAQHACHIPEATLQNGTQTAAIAISSAGGERRRGQDLRCTYPATTLTLVGDTIGVSPLVRGRAPRSRLGGGRGHRTHHTLAEARRADAER